MTAADDALVLYDDVDSTNAIKVRFLLEELGLPARKVPVALGEARPADYLQLHPFGLVPTLVDGDLVVTESNTALRYLAERAGRADLRGEDARRRARIDMLLDSLSLEVRPALWAVEEVVIYDLQVSAEERAARMAALGAALDGLERLTDPAGPYLLGDFTIADCAVAGRGKHLPALGLADAVAPRLRAAVAAAQARPAYARARVG